MEEEKQVRYDVDGFDVVTAVLRELLNQYPGLSPGDEIAFSVLDENSGKAMFPVSGAIIETERKDITGHVKQICLYPFYVIYRAAGLSENQKAKIKEWLDTLGRWLEGQKIIINQSECQLTEYPQLTGNREFLSISRQGPAYLDSTNENRSENWAVYIAARYRNEFDTI